MLPSAAASHVATTAALVTPFCDFNLLVDFIARERSPQTLGFRYFRPDVILYLQKRTLIKRIGLFICRGWAQHIVDRWRDAFSYGPSPSTSDDFDLLPCAFPLEFFTAVLTAVFMCQALKPLIDTLLRPSMPGYFARLRNWHIFFTLIGYRGLCNEHSPVGGREKNKYYSII